MKAYGKTLTVDVRVKGLLLLSLPVSAMPVGQFPGDRLAILMLLAAMMEPSAFLAPE